MTRDQDLDDPFAWAAREMRNARRADRKITKAEHVALLVERPIQGEAWWRQQRSNA
jgi:hypothetical protein